MYQNLTSNISQSRQHTSSIFMPFSIKSGTLNSKMKWKPEPEVVFRGILAKNQISWFLGLVSRWYVYVRRRRDRLIDQSTGDTLDRRRGPETELLCPGEPTPITLSNLVVPSVECKCKENLVIKSEIEVAQLLTKRTWCKLLWLVTVFTIILRKF